MINYCILDEALKFYMEEYKIKDKYNYRVDNIISEGKNINIVIELIEKKELKIRTINFVFPKDMKQDFDSMIYAIRQISREIILDKLLS